jgi:hypothetical protein
MVMIIANELLSPQKPFTRYVKGQSGESLNECEFATQYLPV